MASVDCREIYKSFGKQTVLNGFSLALPDGQVTALLGSSGAGKTTVGRIIAGLERLDRGECLRSHPKDVMFIPQDFVIWPHLTLEQNVSVGCRKKGADATDLVATWLKRLKLDQWRQKKGSDLSHGQQQRVAVARAFCFEPKVMILDEPFAHLDVPSRTEAAFEVAELCRSQEMTTLWITHDVREAFSVSQHISVMESGRVGQTGTPQEIYSTPASETVARLTGDINILSDSEWNEFQKLFCEGNLQAGPRSAQLGFRPHDLELVPQIAGVISERTTFLGNGYYYSFVLPSGNRVLVFDQNKFSSESRFHFKLKRVPCAF